MTTPERQTGSRLQRYAWTVFVFIGVVMFLFGLTDLMSGAATFGQGEAPTFRGITGTTWESTKTSPVAAQIDWMVRAQAIWITLGGALTGLVAATAFRRGERWAWFAMLLVPLLGAVLDLNLYLAVKQWASGIPPPLISGPILILIAVVPLAITFRRMVRRR
ncbi:MAG: hypothetical protein M3R21_08145 [Candidatus Dormibacteraeota bacterium]|nr:hypothetical protein [Candidatus Dormibacteraeota bacterium]